MKSYSLFPVLLVLSLFVFIGACTPEQQVENTQFTLTDDNMPEIDVTVNYDEPSVEVPSQPDFDNMKCVMTTPEGKATMYFMGNKYKSETQTPQGSVTMVNDGSSVYIWQGMQGMKMPLNMMQSGQQGISQLQKNVKGLSEARTEVQQQLAASQANVDCENNVVRSSDFTLPNNIQFQDLAVLVQNAQSTSGRDYY